MKGNLGFLVALAAAITGIFVGSTIVATRFVIAQTTPASLALLRYTIGFVCLVPPTLLAPRVRFAYRDLLPIALLGITQFGILVALLNYAAQFIPAARSALIFATMPLLTLLLGALFQQEKLSTAKTAGVLLTLVGVGLALGEKALQPGSPQGWIGEGLVFVSALSGALCSILYRPYLRTYPTLQVSAFAMLASVGFLALLATTEGFFSTWPPHFTTGGWLAVVFIGVSSGIGYYLWLWALTHAAPTQVTIFLSLSPLTATALGALLLAEPISLFFIAGLGCVGAGLWLALTTAN